MVNENEIWSWEYLCWLTSIFPLYLHTCDFSILKSLVMKLLHRFPFMFLLWTFSWLFLYTQCVHFVRTALWEMFAFQGKGIVHQGQPLKSISGHFCLIENVNCSDNLEMHQEGIERFFLKCVILHKQKLDSLRIIACVSGIKFLTLWMLILYSDATFSEV